MGNIICKWFGRKDLGMFPIVNRGDGEGAQDTDEMAVFDILFALTSFRTYFKMFVVFPAPLRGA